LVEETMATEVAVASALLLAVAVVGEEYEEEEEEGVDDRLVERGVDFLRGLLARCFPARNASAYLEGIPPRCGYP
jgi:hypothetical protein